METTHTSQQLVALLKLLADKKMTPERFTEVFSSGILADVFDPGAYLGNRAAIRLALELVVVMSETYYFEVDYDQTLDAMVAAGNFKHLRDDKAIDVARQFLIRGKGTVRYEGRLLYFNRVTGLVAALETISSIDLDSINPFCAAKIEHMLAFAAAFPHIQCGFRILALGSIAEFGDSDRHNRAVPELGADQAHGRYLFRESIERGIAKHYFLLVVREIST